MATTATQTMTHDAALAVIDHIFAVSPRAAQHVKRVTKAQVLDLLQTLVSESYLNSRTQEITNHPAYMACWNNQLLRPVDVNWSSGSAYTKHAITPRGNSVRKALVAELTPPCTALVPVSHYLAPWLALQVCWATAKRTRFSGDEIREHSADGEALRLQGAM